MRKLVPFVSERTKLVKLKSAFPLKRKSEVENLALVKITENNMHKYLR